MEPVKHKLPAEETCIHFWVDGQNDPAPFQEMQSFLSRSILWTVRVRPASVRQIAEAVQSHPAYVQDAVDRMRHLEILKEAQRGRYIAADFFFDAAAVKRVRMWAEARGSELAPKIMERMADFHVLFGRLHLHPEGVVWDEVAWPLVGVGLVKPGIMRCLTEPVDPPLKPSGRRYYFQGADFQEMVWRIIGCNMQDDEQWAVMQYWSPEVHPPTMGLPGHPTRLLEPLVKHQEQGVAPDALLERGAVADEMELARLIERGILSSANGRMRLAPPYLPGKEWRMLRDQANRFMESLQNPIGRMLQGVEDLLDELGFVHLRSIYPEGKQLLATNIAGECMMALKQAGALPEVPEPAPDTWDRLYNIST